MLLFSAWMTFIDLEIRGYCSLEQKGLPYECGKKEPIHERDLKKVKETGIVSFLFTFHTSTKTAWRTLGFTLLICWRQALEFVSAHFIYCFSWQFHMITTEMELITWDIFKEDLQEIHVSTFKINVPPKFWAASITRSQRKIIYSRLSLLY